MAEPRELVADGEQFFQLSTQCSELFERGTRLPEFVFKRSFGRYFVIEHGHTYRKEFGVLLARLAAEFKDSHVNYMTFQPSAVDYYHAHFSFYGIASFDPSTLPDRYLPVMKNPPAYFSAVADVGGFWGSSMQWAIACDRISWEICVLAMPHVDQSLFAGFRLLTPSTLAEYEMSQYCMTNLATARDFTSRFLANYSI